MLYLDETLATTIRRLSMAQSSDGSRLFTGSVSLSFEGDDAILSCDDPGWTCTDDRVLDTRLLRDPLTAQRFTLEDHGIPTRNVRDEEYDEITPEQD